MPTQLDGVSVNVGGRPAYVSYISPGQINVLTAPDPLEGLTNVVVTNGGIASGTVVAQTELIAPSLFTFDGTHVAAVHLDGTYVGATNLYPGLSTPARAGETIVLFGNGFGTVSNSVVPGAISQSGTLSTAPVIKVGGVAASVQFAGLVAPGEYQFNIILPQNLPDGDLPVVVVYEGAQTQMASAITVKN